MPLPDWLVNAPVLREDLTFYMLAFIDLTTERQIGMGEGPIPWSKMREYAIHWELDTDEFDALVFIVQSMDSEYLGYRASQMKK